MSVKFLQKISVYKRAGGLMSVKADKAAGTRTAALSVLVII